MQLHTAKHMLCRWLSPLPHHQSTTNCLQAHTCLVLRWGCRCGSGAHACVQQWGGCNVVSARNAPHLLSPPLMLPSCPSDSCSSDHSPPGPHRKPPWRFRLSPPPPPRAPAASAQQACGGQWGRGMFPRLRQARAEVSGAKCRGCHPRHFATVSC